MKKRTYPLATMGSFGGLPDEERLLMNSPEFRAEYLRQRAAQLVPRKPSPDLEAKKIPARFPPKPSVHTSNHLHSPIKNDVNSKRLHALNQEIAHRDSTAAVTNQRFRLFGVDNAIASCSRESNKTLPGSSSSSILPALTKETLDLFPLTPIKNDVNSKRLYALNQEIAHRDSTAAVTNQRFRLSSYESNKMRKLIIGESETLPGSSSRSFLPPLAKETLDLFPLAPIRDVVDLELSLGCGSGNRKDPGKKTKKNASQQLESDGDPIKNDGNQKAPMKEQKKTGHGLESDRFLCCVHPVAPQRKN